MVEEVFNQPQVVPGVGLGKAVNGESAAEAARTTAKPAATTNFRTGVLSAVRDNERT
jgi:hypothetical protein